MDQLQWNTLEGIVAKRDQNWKMSSTHHIRIQWEEMEMNSLMEKGNLQNHEFCPDTLSLRGASKSKKL